MQSDSILLLFVALLPLFATAALGDERGAKEGADLTHDEALRWANEHDAWRPARKTKPIWARLVAADEAGKEFETADHVKQRAQKDHCLCVGSAGEPWFQTPDKLNSKYERDGEVTKRFSFDDKEHVYGVFKPKPDHRNWVAQVKGPGIKGFSIKPHYDPSRPLYSPAGGYIVKDDCDDPKHNKINDVWLVQKPLFESTYELLPDGR